MEVDFPAKQNQAEKYCVLFVCSMVFPRKDSLTKDV